MSTSPCLCLSSTPFRGEGTRYSGVELGLFSSDNRYQLSAHLDPHNTGVLVVDLQGRDQGGRSRDAGGLVDDLEKDDTGCVIM